MLASTLPKQDKPGLPRKTEAESPARGRAELPTIFVAGVFSD